MSGEGKNGLLFQNYHKQMKVPFVIYADLEALIIKIEGPKRDLEKSYTQSTQFHKAYSYSYIVVWCDGKANSLHG